MRPAGQSIAGNRAGRILRALGAGSLLTVIVVGAPCVLAATIGNPLSSWPDLLVGDISDTVCTDLLACVAWLAWARFAVAVLTEAWIVIRQTPQPHGSLPRGLRGWARSLLAALLIGLPAAAPLSALADAPVTVPATSIVIGAPRPAVVKPAVEKVVIVRDGPQTLWALAEARLGSGQRWHEIWALNRGRHQPDGTVMTDPNLLRPGWSILVPAPATGSTPSRYVVAVGDTMSKIAEVQLGDATRWPQICRLNQHHHPEKYSTVIRDCDLIYPGLPLLLPRDAVSSTRRPVSTAPGAQTKTPSTRTPTVTITPEPRTATPTPVPRTAVPTPQMSPDDRLRDVVAGSLAAALAAAVALVTGRRTRRRARHREPDTLTRTELVRGPATVDNAVMLTRGGVGVIGSSADEAARAVLVDVLTSIVQTAGEPIGEVVIDRATWVRLFGNELVPVRPGLYVPDELESALTRVEERLLYRTRLAQDHALLEPAAPDTAAPDTAAPHPADRSGQKPVVLLSEPPSEHLQSLVRNLLALGRDLGIRAVFLGIWNDGLTIDVGYDGQAHYGDGAPIAERVSLVDRDMAVRVLMTPPETRPLEAISAGFSPALPPTSITPDRETATAKPRLNVFGSPRVENISRAGRPLRAKAAELATFLACHPDGADTRTIGDHLEPDVRLHNADVHVHTNVSNLRHVLGRAAGPRRIGYVIKVHGRYRLDRDTVDVDLWELTDLLAQAATASQPERIHLLQRACALYTAPLADGCLYEWVEPYRERARRQAIAAHVRLAEDLLDTDPRAASDVLDAAIRLDRYDENLYTAAMQARHRSSDSDGIRALERALTTALAELDLEAEPATLALAQRLCTDIAQEGHGER